MRKFIVYITIIAMTLCLWCPHNNVVYASSTTQDNDGLLDILADCVYSVASGMGAIVSFVQGDLDKGLQKFINALDPNYGMDEWLADAMKLREDGSVDLSKDLYDFIKQFIEENTAQKVNISDYIFKYYPDREISSVRLPSKSENNDTVNAWVINSYNHIMEATGTEGKQVVDDLTKHKYYWMAYALMGGDSTTDKSGNTVYGARYAYVDSQYENDIIFIKSGNNLFDMYQYDKSYQTFSNVPMNYITYSYANPSEIKVIDVTEVNKYVYGSTYLLGSVNAVQYAFSMQSGWYAYFAGAADSDYPTLGSPLNYFGTVRFPIWQSQEKYVEYMTLFPNYNPETYITNNEDNSVTINNFYYPESGDNKPTTDYSGQLQEAIEYLQGIITVINSLSRTVDRNFDELLQWLRTNKASDYTDILQTINNNIVALGTWVGGSSSSADLDEVVKYLKKINDKLLYNNVVETLDTVADWLDLLLGDDDEESSKLLEVAKAALSEAMETKFPFSIVFSFQALVLLLQAEPVEPVFEVPFKMAALNIDESIVIDFTKFDTVIIVLQWFIIFFYIYALMQLTTKFLKIGGDS